MNGNRLFFKKTGVNRNRLLEKKKRQKHTKDIHGLRLNCLMGKKGYMGGMGLVDSTYLESDSVIKS